MTGKLGVVLIDDQALFRSGVTVGVDAQADMAVVGQAADGREGLAVIAATSPDVVLLDVRMPVMDGVQMTERLFSPEWSGPTPKVIVLTTFGLDAAAGTAIRNGASGFLLKDTTLDFLVASIRTVAAGTTVLAPGAIADLFAADSTRVSPPPPTYATLTERERSVFALAARGLSNAEIASGEFLSESTVKTHISSILSKLALRDRVQLVVFAHDHELIGRR
jgi:DNA-binding NarL/FixJ family response regulator